MPSPRPDERALPIDLGICWNIGAPTPTLVQNEFDAWLLFYVQEYDPAWEGTHVKVLDPGSPGAEALGIIHWLGCRGAVLGGVNDEARHGHRLWNRGFSSDTYGAYEVRPSAWIKRLRDENRVHPRHSEYPFTILRHFLLGFHDSTFECVARSFYIETRLCSYRDALREIADRAAT